MASSRLEEAAREASEALARSGTLGQGTTELRARAAGALAPILERLIREAAEVARNTCPPRPPARDSYERIADHILSHFGLEVARPIKPRRLVEKTYEEWARAVSEDDPCDSHPGQECETCRGACSCHYVDLEAPRG